MWSQIEGQSRVKAYLQHRIRTGTVPHALLFCGARNTEKELLAEAFAHELVGSNKGHHPDILHYRPEGKIGMHTIQSLRELSEAVYMAPFEAKKKVFLLHEAHRMLSSGANALLKTFEEPALHSIIILLSDKPEQLLPTIRSRCQTVRIGLEKAQEIEPEKSETQRKVFEALANGVLQSYPQLIELAKELAASIDKTLKERESVLHKQLLEPFQDGPTAQQRHAIEKEVEGVLAAQKQESAKEVFESVLFWFRDLLLLSVGADAKHLFFKEGQSLLEAAQKKGHLQSIESIEKAVGEAQLALERSTGLEICFEGLFLKLM